MGPVDSIINKLKNRFAADASGERHEFCPRCEADLTMQKGYSSSVSYWVCRGCGEMLINPDVDADDNVAWICDECGAMLNTQEGFANNNGLWSCSKCGFVNKIDPSEIYESESEYEADLSNPYKGMDDASLLELLSYTEIEKIQGRDDVVLVKGAEDGRLCIRKTLSVYDSSVFEFLMAHPVENMPRIYGIYKADHFLTVIEEYIEGRTLADILKCGRLEVNEAVLLVRGISRTLKSLHELERPIVHRDIKPSNIIVTDEGKPYLIDINIAKWYKADESSDTRLLGTRDYAAPEQLGFGLSASDAKADIYAMGILLNVMVTGTVPKEEKAPEAIWDIVQHCIALEPTLRYTDDELIGALDNILR